MGSAELTDAIIIIKFIALLPPSFCLLPYHPPPLYLYYSLSLPLPLSNHLSLSLALSKSISLNLSLPLFSLSLSFYRPSTQSPLTVPLSQSSRILHCVWLQKRGEEGHHSNREMLTSINILGGFSTTSRRERSKSARATSLCV